MASSGDQVLTRDLPSGAYWCQLAKGGPPIASSSPRSFFHRFRLLSRATGVMDVVTVITAKGEIKMTELIAETAAAPKAASIEKPKANNKARVAPVGAHVAKKAAKSPKKASPAKKAPKGAKKASSAREGSKTNTVLELLKCPGGVTAKELMKATGWQPHSVRGFLSGTIGKKMGLAVTSTKAEDGERTYSVKA
jgi:hypothetical protein